VVLDMLYSDATAIDGINSFLEINLKVNENSIDVEEEFVDDDTNNLINKKYTLFKKVSLKDGLIIN